MLLTHRRSSATLLIVAVAAGSLLTGCASSDSSSPAASESAAEVSVDLPTKPMSQADADAFDKAIQGVLDDPASQAELAPGTWVGVWVPEKGYFMKAYGNATLDGQPAALDQHLRIGSVSKTFTATAVLMLVDDGKLSLDDTVADVLPDTASAYPVYAGVTVEQLLRMQSGVPDFLNVPNGLVNDVAKDPTRMFTVDDILTSATSNTTAPAGTIGYSSTNYIVLEEMVNKVSGTTLQEFIADRITGPLGMNNTELPDYEIRALPEPSARGYATGPADGLEGCRAEFALLGGEVEQDADLSEYTQSLTRGAGAMSSTVADLGIWSASKSGNVLLSEELQGKRLQITPDIFLNYGMGIMEVPSESGLTFLGHEGDAFGYQAYALKEPTSGASVVVMNNTCGLAGLMDKIVAALPLPAASASPATS